MKKKLIKNFLFVKNILFSEKNWIFWFVTTFWMRNANFNFFYALIIGKYWSLKKIEKKFLDFFSWVFWSYDRKSNFSQKQPLSFSESSHQKHQKITEISQATTVYRLANLKFFLTLKFKLLNFFIWF